MSVASISWDSIEMMTRREGYLARVGRIVEDTIRETGEQLNLLTSMNALVVAMGPKRDAASMNWL